MTPNDAVQACERAARRLGVFSDTEARDLIEALDRIAIAFAHSTPGEWVIGARAEETVLTLPPDGA